MNRTVRLLYTSISLTNSYFWLGIWVLYYLQFTNYTGIATIEAVAFITVFVFEIPTGALADLFGMKKTLQWGYLLMAFGNIVMALASSFSYLILSVIFIALGGALASGTTDALLYETLKKEGNERLFDKYLSHIRKYSLIALGISSILGGFLYQFQPSSPFWITGLSMFIAAMLVFFMKEPSVYREKFTITGYINQNREGFRELFSNSAHLPLLLSTLFIASFIYITWNVLDSVLAIEAGFSSSWLGILFALTVFANAIGNHYYVSFVNKWGKKAVFVIASFVVVGTSLLSPIFGLWLAGAAILLRNSVYSVPDIIASSEINRFVRSEFRATTLSTFTMLKGVPYALFALIIGSAVDRWAGSHVAMILAVIYVLVGGSTLLYLKVFSKRS